MSIFETIVIAVVEGLTEFLPVSSTGHMIIAQNLLGVESTDFVKAFTFIIQFGAILSVLILYWKRFFQLNQSPAPEGASAVKRILHKYDFYWKLFIAFIPAAVFGLLFSDAIDAMLDGNHRGWYVSAIDSQGSRRVLLLPCRAHHACRYRIQSL